MKAKRFRSRSILLGVGVVLSSLALVALPSVGYSAWHSAVSVPETVSAATVPTPGSASVVAGSATTTTYLYSATVIGKYCPEYQGEFLVEITPYDQCEYRFGANGYTYVMNRVDEYSCPYGGYQYGSNCDTTTTTPDIKFTWATPTAYDASGQDFVTGVDVVEGSSCSASSWKVVATVSPSTDSYTVDNPSTSEYYGLQTKGLGGWTSTVSGCTLG